jgi:hypothetical protein
MRMVGVLDLVEPFDTVVVGEQTGIHDVSRGHAVAHLDVGIHEAQSLGGKPVDVGRRAGKLASESTDRIAVHIVDRDEEDVDR